MARPRNPVPSYRLHKQSGQAVVTLTLNGVRKDILLGPHGSPESKEEYERVLAQLRTPAGAAGLVRSHGGNPRRPGSDAMARLGIREDQERTAEGGVT